MIRALIIEHELELLAAERPLPGVEDMLAEAQMLRMKLAVASNTCRAWAAFTGR